MEFQRLFCENPWQYSTNIYKWIGCVYESQQANYDSRWCAKYKKNNGWLKKRFLTQELATQWLFDYCKKNNMINNRYRYIDDDTIEYEIKVHNNISYGLIDARDFHILDSHFISESMGYAMASRNNGQKLLHLLIMPRDTTNKKEAIDHINRNRLDNRRCNLRLVSQKINSLNKDKDEYGGLVKNRVGTSWKITLTLQSGAHISKQFSVDKHGIEKAKQLANKWRAEKIREVPDYAYALNLYLP
jgi:hypothetical protein